MVMYVDTVKQDGSNQNNTYKQGKHLHSYCRNA